MTDTTLILKSQSLRVDLIKVEIPVKQHHRIQNLGGKTLFSIGNFKLAMNKKLEIIFLRKKSIFCLDIFKKDHDGFLTHLTATPQPSLFRISGSITEVYKSIEMINFLVSKILLVFMPKTKSTCLKTKNIHNTVSQP